MRRLVDGEEKLSVFNRAVAAKIGWMKQIELIHADLQFNIMYVQDI